MTVVDILGRSLGEVAEVLAGAPLAGAAFFALREDGRHAGERLVPTDVVRGADAGGRLRLTLTREQVGMMPAYRGEAPTPEEARHAYALLGGLPGDPISGEGAHMVPFADTAPRDHRTDEAALPPLDMDLLLMMAAEERDKQADRDAAAPERDGQRP